MNPETLTLLIGGVANLVVIFGGFRMVLKDSLLSENRLTRVETKVDSIASDVADIKRRVFNGFGATDSR